MSARPEERHYFRPMVASSNLFSVKSETLLFKALIAISVLQVTSKVAYRILVFVILLLIYNSNNGRPTQRFWNDC